MKRKKQKRNIDLETLILAVVGIGGSSALFIYYFFHG